MSSAALITALSLLAATSDTAIVPEGDLVNDGLDATADRGKIRDAMVSVFGRLGRKDRQAPPASGRDRP